MKAKASVCAQRAMEAADRQPPILYSQEDCQAFVEETARRAGGTMKDYRGSNDMFRNACTRIEPLNSRAGKEMLVPGAVLFILKKDGGEPDRYKADGLGDASHIGWYTGGRYEVVHSSASKGRVLPSTLKNAWTHVGWMKEVDYSEYTLPGAQTNSNQNEVYIMLYEAIVNTGSETLNIRERPASNARVLYRERGGTAVRVLEEVSAEWARVDGTGGQGFAMRQFLSPANASQVGAIPGITPAVVIRCGSIEEATAIVSILRGAEPRTI